MTTSGGPAPGSRHLHGVRSELVLDPDTSATLAVRTVLVDPSAAAPLVAEDSSAGAERAWSVIARSGMVDSTRDRP